MSGWAVCSNGSVTLRLDPSLERGYEMVDVVTFDAAPVIGLLRTHLPTALYAVETGGGRLPAHRAVPGRRARGPAHPRGRDFDELLAQPVCRVVVRSPEHTSEDFMKLTHAVGLHGVNYAVGWTAWLDLAPEGVSKASALEAVRVRLGVDPARTLAVGDGRNDVEMFEWAGRSVAMGNAVDEVKTAADAVALGVLEDGLADVLEAVLPARRPTAETSAGDRLRRGAAGAGVRAQVAGGARQYAARQAAPGRVPQRRPRRDVARTAVDAAAGCAPALAR
jgi:hypothetical protein